MFAWVWNSADFIWLIFFGRGCYHLWRGHGWKRAFF